MEPAAEIPSNEIENQEVPENSAAPIEAVLAESQRRLAAEPELKRKRGRPRKNPEPAQAPAAALAPVQTAPMTPPPDYRGMLKDLAGMASPAIVQYTGSQAAALTAEEQERAAECLNPLMQKWFPEMGEMSPEMAAAIGLASIAWAIHCRVKADLIDSQWDAGARAATPQGAPAAIPAAS